MRLAVAMTILTLLLPAVGSAGQEHVYRWVDENGQVHYGDSIPAEAADLEKQVVNATGVPLDTLRGKRTAEEIAEEMRQAELAVEDRPFIKIELCPFPALDALLLLLILLPKMCLVLQKNHNQLHVADAGKGLVAAGLCG